MDADCLFEYIGEECDCRGCVAAREWIAADLLVERTQDAAGPGCPQGENQ